MARKTALMMTNAAECDKGIPAFQPVHEQQRHDEQNRRDDSEHERNPIAVGNRLGVRQRYGHRELRDTRDGRVEVRPAIVA